MQLIHRGRQRPDKPHSTVFPGQSCASPLLRSGESSLPRGRMAHANSQRHTLTWAVSNRPLIGQENSRTAPCKGSPTTLATSSSQWPEGFATQWNTQQNPAGRGHNTHSVLNSNSGQRWPVRLAPVAYLGRRDRHQTK